MNKQYAIDTLDEMEKSGYYSSECSERHTGLC